MKKEVGLWIDHKKAVIVNFMAEETTINKIDSNIQKYFHPTGETPHCKSFGSELFPTEIRSKKSVEHLNKFYDQVITNIQDAGSILILGPGEAKFELEKRLGDELRGRVIAIETADKMTDRQLAARVREGFQKLAA